MVLISLALASLASARLAGQERQVVKVPTLIQSLAYAPKEGIFAAGFEGENATLIYDVKRLDQPTPIRGEYGRARALAFSPDGKVVAIPDAWRTPGAESIGVRLWDYRNLSERGTLPGHEGFVTAVAFSPDGGRLITGDDHGSVLLWDVERTRLLRKLPAHDSVVTAAAFSPDGKKVVTTGQDKRAIIADAQTGQELATLRGHEGWVLATTFIDGGKLLLTADGNGEVRAWDFPSGKLCSRMTLKVNDREPSLKVFIFSSDGRLAASGDAYTNIVRVWDVVTGAERATFEHTKLYHCTCLAFAPDGRTLISGAEGHVQGGVGDVLSPGEIRIWELSKLVSPK
jgi:WD40 repeat protein